VHIGRQRDCEQWNDCYTDMPNRLRKVAVRDRNLVTITGAGRRSQRSVRNLKNICHGDALARDCQIQDHGRAAERRDGPAAGRGDGSAAGLLFD